MSTTTAPPHEWSAWMRTRIAGITARAAVVNARCPDDVIVTPLGPTGPAGSRLDRSCDRCERYVPVGVGLWMIRLHQEPWLIIYGGLCEGCVALEVTQ